MSDAMMMAKAHRGTTGIATFTAEMLKQDTRIASFSIGGWDTHVGQTSGFKRPLKNLPRRDYDPENRAWSDLGQDHCAGHDRIRAHSPSERQQGDGSRNRWHRNRRRVVRFAAARFTETGPDWRKRICTTARDLMPTADIRIYAAAAMQGLFNATASQIEGTIFPGLDLSPGLPGIIA